MALTRFDCDKKLNIISNSANEINKNLTNHLNQIRSDIDVHLQSTSRVSPSNDHLLAKLCNEIAKINSMVAYDLGNQEVQSMNSRVQSRNMESILSNITDESNRLIRNNGLSLLDEKSALKDSPFPEREDPSIDLDLDVTTDVNPNAASAEIIEDVVTKCGHLWKISDWSNRLSRLEANNKTWYVMTRCPGFADASWICSLFKKKFSIDICECNL